MYCEATFSRNKRGKCFIFGKQLLHYVSMFSILALEKQQKVTQKYDVACVADILRLKAVSVGFVVIKGEMTGRYLAMNKNGHLYGSVSFGFSSVHLSEISSSK